MLAYSELTPAQKRAVEALFAMEVEGREGQVHPQTFIALRRRGWAEAEGRKTSSGLLGVALTYNVHYLTHAGRLAYCEWCARQRTEDLE